MILTELISSSAELIGCPEAALTLLISLLLGYPIAFVHRKCLYGVTPNLQHIYFILCGIILCCFNYGWDVIHSFIAITVTCAALKILGGGLTSLLIVFTYTMLHLTIGYWATATSTYDIKWTMPQCVLTLRLIGLAFNVYDGSLPPEGLSEENQKVALPTVPSVLEIFAHSYFPSSFLVGPQFSFKRYKDFVELKLEEKEDPSELPNSMNESRRSLFLGLIYLIMYQIGSLYIPDNYFISEEFRNLNMFKKIFFLGLWGRFTLYKYISCWLLTEGSCIMMGLTYNGLDEKEKPKWDGCANVKLKIFETSTKMNHYIESFNINTNQWIAQFIYKRLKFLKNKKLSYFGALIFLAVWHGLHSGYYATFFFEYLVITSEKHVITLFKNTALIKMILETKITNLILKSLLHVYTFVIMGYAMIPFILLKHDKYLQVFKQFYFLPHIICLTIIISYPIFNKRRPATPPSAPPNPQDVANNPTGENKPDAVESSKSSKKKK